MSDSDFDMDDSDQGEEDSDNDDWVEFVPIRHTRALYQVLDTQECFALASAEVAQVYDLLCCEADVAASLLRQFRWNREKLTAGARCRPLEQK